MKAALGYNSFLKTLSDVPELSAGVMLDTNVLVSATYEPQKSHDSALEFLDLLIENDINLFCNVNVRSEFLEVHRRIIFTEALLDFEFQIDKSRLPLPFVKKLNSLRTMSSKRLNTNRNPLRLPDYELKIFKYMMTKIKFNSKNLWKLFCESKIKNKLLDVWLILSKEFGIHFLSFEDHSAEPIFSQRPKWEEVIGLMESHGLSSADAMILNMFLNTKLKAIVSSDMDMALALNSMPNINKFVFIPNQMRKDLK